MNLECLNLLHHIMTLLKPQYLNYYQIHLLTTHHSSTSRKVEKIDTRLMTIVVSIISLETTIN
jgi:hypothetical protein